MTVAAEYRSLKQILSDFKQIIIPDVQRDYVMGSGGSKLEELLQAMVEVVQKKDSKDELFNFSCLVGYKDNENNLHIYDGQQRLATLVYLCSYLNNENINLEKKLLLEKFCFTDRSEANEWLRNPNLIEEDNATDFTTYSLVQLIKQFKAFSNEFDFDFLFNKVVFSLVLVDKISDAQQFFLDINDGLDLKTYEVYKAELCHHAKAKLSKGAFRNFSLKMENEWLKFFLTYRYEQKKFIDGSMENIEIHSEEEMLVFFLQFCFRMMWIEENQTDIGYKQLSISWLREEHIQRVEEIIDTIIIKIKTSYISEITCINYSNNENYYYDYRGRPSRGQHWAIADENYVSMLDTFLKNAYSEEINKDIVIWCYISNLPFLNDNKYTLYNYLRFVKKLLNNNRKISEQAEILFGGWGANSKDIIYARYYVEGIPQYYSRCKKEELGENTLELFDSIIVSNKAFILDSEKNFVDIYLHELKIDSYKSILEKEQQKKEAEQKEIIEKYENLKFINGLVDNLLVYKNGECFLNKFWEEEFYNTFSKENSLENKYQYKDILNFLLRVDVNLIETIFSDVYVYWYNYRIQNESRSYVTPHRDKGSLIPHTWCDFLTSEQGISFDKGSQKKLPEYLAMLPDGWIIEYKIIQPEDDSYTEKGVGFASRAKKHTVWDMECFSHNFSWISQNENSNYIIDGRKQSELPTYLNESNDENWVVNNLVEKKKIFFTTDIHLNKILLKKLQIVAPLTGEKFYDKNDQQVGFETYLKVKKGYMRLSKLDHNYYFIKIDDIE